MTFMELRSLTKRYEGDKEDCVRSVDLKVNEGEIVVLLGPSGCGKTTMLKMIAGLIEPTSGDVLIDGESMLSLPTERRDVSMVFQRPLLFPHMTVAQNIGFGLRVRKAPREKIERKVTEMLELVRLEGYGKRRTDQLSGGQEQRVSLARALMVGPRLLLLDEPLSALDAELRREMRELIKEINRRYGTTMMFVTHDLQEAVALADRIALMIDGEVVQCDRPSSFYTRPRTRRAAEFFGWTNFVPAVQKGRTVICPLGEFTFPGLEEHDGPVCLTIRPEAAALCPKGEGVIAAVRSAAYLGTTIDYEVDCMGCRLGISLDPDHMHEEGEEINIRFAPAKMWAVSCDDNAVCGNRVIWQDLMPLKATTSQTIERKAAGGTVRGETGMPALRP